mmetsp:Transcript_36671/g.88913  ORF Transcript_36671/g.88913 Transcript_36671/m.88913 type:complete len:357 (-) Transcript_36671:830-1900(-)
MSEPKSDSQNDEVTEEAIDERTTSSSASSCSSIVFESMISNRAVHWLFLLVLPILWSILIAVGWTREDIIETDVNAIWTQQRGSYKQDLDYAEQFNEGALGDLTSFAAMAVARDGGNLFTPERLETIRQRMEQAEKATVTYNGNTFSWDDLCAYNSVGINTTYQFPCARFSPMDFFQEAKWFFDEDDRVTWYREVARKIVVAPRVPRYGIMTSSCSTLLGASSSSVPRTECNSIIAKRLLAGEPLALFSDIGNLEMNDPCKACIESEVENVAKDLLEKATTMFLDLAVGLNKANQTELVQPHCQIQKHGRCLFQQVFGHILYLRFNASLTRIIHFQIANIRKERQGFSCKQSFSNN